MNRLSDSILVVALFSLVVSHPIKGDPAIQSQAWANLDKKGSYTDFQFDEKGFPLQKKIYEGLDKSGRVTSQTDYYYDARLKLILEKTSLSNALSSSTEFQYDALGKTKVIIYKTNENIEKFRDSLFYDQGGNRTEQRTYLGSTLLFLHKLTYQSDNLIADTSFEKNGSALIAKQVHHIDYDNSNRPYLERLLWQTNGIWYAIRSKQMTYTNSGILANENSFEGLGETATLLASTSFQYNGNSLKIKEVVLDGNGKIQNTTEYSWKEGVSSVRNISAADASRMALNHIKGQYMTVQGSALRLLDLSGRQLFSAQDINNSQSIRLSSPAILTKPIAPTSPQSSRSR